MEEHETANWFLTTELKFNWTEGSRRREAAFLPETRLNAK